MAYWRSKTDKPMATVMLVIAAVTIAVGYWMVAIPLLAILSYAVGGLAFALACGGFFGKELVLEPGDVLVPRNQSGEKDDAAHFEDALSPSNPFNVGKIGWPDVQ